MTGPGDQQIHVFVSYSHKDQRWVDRLQTHLKPLGHDYDVNYWDDSKIRPGADWRAEIRAEVDRANVAVLVISADYLASEFIRQDELPPLLKAAEDEGALILPLIVSPSLFMRQPKLARFQAINDPTAPLISATPGEQEDAFVKIAEAILEKAIARRKPEEPPTDVDIIYAPTVGIGEDFLKPLTWSRLLQTGDWIFDEQPARIIGSGTHAYLVSREEYGAVPFTIETTLEFSNFALPTENKLGMNAAIVFGFKRERESPSYLNVLLTGSELLLERNDWAAVKPIPKFAHITKPVPFVIESGVPYEFKVAVGEKNVQVFVRKETILTVERPTGVVGRVGLRPWRSTMDCTRFLVLQA
jgi:hypothetical protein